MFNSGIRKLPFPVFRRGKRHILIWDFFSTFWDIFCYLRQASCNGVRFQASFDHFRNANWTEDWAWLTLWSIEVWGRVTMEAKFLDLNNLSWQRRPFALSNDGRKVWATIFILSAIMQRSHACHLYHFFFLPYLQDHGLLRSRNFATMATWRNGFSSLMTRHYQDLGSASSRFKQF